MKNTFNCWPSMIENQSIDVVANYILTNKKAVEFLPDEWLFQVMGSPQDKLKILDFGCGIGRNTFGMSEYSPNFDITGYDHPTMLTRTNEFYYLKYGKYAIPTNTRFVDDWEYLKTLHFDWILCTLVLQHIHEKDLAVYVEDFKRMTFYIAVNSRRLNDDSGKNTWGILEKCGIHPYKCYGWGSGGFVERTFEINGDNEEHFTCFYKI